MAEAATYSQSGTLSTTQSSQRVGSFARLVSDILSPPMMAIPCMAVGVLYSDVPGTVWYALMYLAVALPLPLVFVMWLVKTGRVTDFHLSARRERIAPFAASVSAALLAAMLLAYYEAPTVFLAPVLTALIQTMLLFVITLVWQISIHTATVAALATFTILALGVEMWPVAVLVPLVAWSRLYLNRHTLAQVVGGAVVGAGTFLTLFALRGIVW